MVKYQLREQQQVVVAIHRYSGRKADRRGVSDFLYPPATHARQQIQDRKNRQNIILFSCLISEYSFEMCKKNVILL